VDLIGQVRVVDDTEHSLHSASTLIDIIKSRNTSLIDDMLLC
jgi:hypothetical protein